MVVSDFKIGDRVRFINGPRKGDLAVVTGVGLEKTDFVFVKALNELGEEYYDVEVWCPWRFEIVERAEVKEHPNQKLANEVAEILRHAADEVLQTSEDNHWDSTKNYYSCNAAYRVCKMYQWSHQKRVRVLDRYLRSLGLDVVSGASFNGFNRLERQLARFGWLYDAANFAEQNPGLVPTYGKKSVA